MNSCQDCRFALVGSERCGLDGGGDAVATIATVRFEFGNVSQIRVAWWARHQAVCFKKLVVSRHRLITGGLRAFGGLGGLGRQGVACAENDGCVSASVLGWFRCLSTEDGRNLPRNIGLGMVNAVLQVFSLGSSITGRKFKVTEFGSTRYPKLFANPSWMAFVTRKPVLKRESV